MPVIQTIKGKVSWLFRAVSGLSFWQKASCVLQAVIFDKPIEKDGEWFFEDQSGVRDGVLESNVGLADGIDDTFQFGIGLASKAFTYENGTGVTQNDVTDASGNWLPSAGKIGDIQFKTGEVLDDWFKVDESGGTTLYNSVQGRTNATLVGVDVNLFWVTDNKFQSWQNEVGYSSGIGDVLIPAQVDGTGILTGKDALGNTLQNKGKVRYDVKAVNSNIYELDGVSDLIDLNSVEINSAEFTAIVRCKINDIFDTNKTLFSIGSIIAGQGGVKLFFSANSTTAFFVVSDSVGARNLETISIDDINTNEEIEIAVTANLAGYKRIFINGVKQGEVDISNLSGQILGGGNTYYGNNAPSTESLSQYLSLFCLYNRELSDSELTNCDEIDAGLILKYSCAEGGGDVAYNKADVPNPVHGSIVADLNTFHALDNGRPDNSLDGFDLWQDDVTPTNFVRVPFDVNGNSIKTDGDTITGFTWISRNPSGAWHNNAETEMLWPDCNATKEVDDSLSAPFLTDGSVPIAKSYADFEAEGGNVYDDNQIFYNLDFLREIVCFKEDARTLYPDCFTKALQKIDKNEQLLTSEGEPVLDENGVPQYVLK
jgi:hypothetical protein